MEKVAGDGARRHDGAAWTVHLDHRLSVVCRRRSGMAWPGRTDLRPPSLVAIHDRTRFLSPRLRRRDHSALQWLNLRRVGRILRSARSYSGHCGTDLPQSTGGTASLSRLAITAGLCEEFSSAGFAMRPRPCRLQTWVRCCFLPFSLGSHIVSGSGGIVMTLLTALFWGSAWPT